jgi:hypothetical protein
MPLVIAGATSGSTTVQATDAVTATITLPSATDTLVGKATTDTLTNKTLTLPVVGTTIGVGGATPSASGAGITFPATQSASTNANTLDDYEEGSWTVTMTANGFTPTSNTVGGAYTKIGRVVVVTGIAQMTVPASLGTYVNNSIDSGISISGLPFVIANDILYRSAPVIGVSLKLGTSSGVLAGHGSSNDTSIAIFQNNDGGGTRTSPTLYVSSTVNVHFCFTYMTT